MGNRDVRIRARGPDDLDRGLIQSLARLHAEAMAAGMSLGATAATDLEELHRAALADPARVVLVAEDGDDVVGMAHIVPSTAANASHRAEVQRVAVAESARGSGVGRRLMEAVETEAEAREETDKMLKVYAEFARDYLAIPVHMGEKTEGERFPGAVQTLCIEAMMQDRKALQAGTSHFLGQNFAKSSGIKFLSRDNKEELAWTSSWGVSTRLIGMLIMVHADDDGMIVPPRVAPTQVVILPIIPKPEVREAVLKGARELAEKIRDQVYARASIEVEVDERDLAGGAKSWEWIKKGAPLRIEIGPRDLEKGTVALYRRDQGPKEKTFPVAADVPASLPALLQDIQDNLYKRALALREQHTVQIDSEKDFYAFFTPKNPNKPEIHGGFALAHFNGSREVEEKLKNDLKVTVRCIPHELDTEPGTCIFTGQPSRQRVIFAKAY